MGYQYYDYSLKESLQEIEEKSHYNLYPLRCESLCNRSEVEVFNIIIRIILNFKYPLIPYRLRSFR